MTPTDRKGLRILAVLCLSPALIAVALLSILWQMVCFAWWWGEEATKNFFTD